MKIRRMALLAVVPALLALTGCAGGGDDSGVATANGGKAADAKATPSLNPRDAQLKFAQCMRQNGVDMPDPEPGQAGVRIQSKKGERGKTDAAMKKCGPFLEAGRIGPKPDDPKVRDQMLKLAQCLRQHGVNVPDPQPGQGMRMRVDKGSKAKVEAAHKACEQFLPGGGKAPPSVGGSAGGGK
jgi:hypothetical protein